MPQAIAKIGRERTIGTLTRNLFVIEQGASAKETKQAEAALLRANPHLKTAEGFKSGATVIIPGTIQLKPTDRVERADTTLSGVLLETANRLEIAVQLARDGFADSNEQIKGATKTLKSRRFRESAIKQSEAAEALIKSALKNQSNQLKTNKQREEDFTQAFKENMTEIDALSKLIKD